MTALEPFAQLSGVPATPADQSWSPFESMSVLPQFQSPTPQPFFSRISAGLSLPMQQPTHPSLIPNLPQTTTALINKYNKPEINELLANVSPSISSALINFDADRALKGQTPLSQKQTSLVLSTASSGRQATPEKEHGASILGLPGAFTRDLRQLVTSLPQLPATAVKEVAALPTIPTEIGKAMSTHGGLGEQVQALTHNVPGIRMLPGAYTLGNIAGGDAGEILKHPLFTGLDVAPYTKGLAAGPLGTAIKESAAGDLARAGTASFKATNLGQRIQEAFGAQSRTMMRGEGLETFRLLHQIDPKIAAEPGTVSRFVKDSREWGAKYQETIPIERRMELFNAAERQGVNIPGLNDVERAYVHDARDFANDAKKYALDRNWAYEHDNELYSPEQYKRIQKHQEKLNNDIEVIKWRAANTEDPVELSKLLERRQRADARFQRKVDRIIPARFVPLAEDYLNTKIAARAREVALEPEMAVQRALDHSYSTLVDDGLLTQKEYRKWEREAIDYAADLKRRGADPIFIHHVAPERATTINYPRPLHVMKDISSSKTRTLDIAPHVKDFTVAIPAHGIEMLQYDATERLLTRLLDTTGEVENSMGMARSRSSLERQYEGPAHARMASNPSLDSQAWIEKMIRREYQEVTPEMIPDKLKPALSGALKDRVYLPKAVWRNIERLSKPEPWQALVDVPLSAFRTSVLALRPNWHVNNIVGGGIMTAAQTDPIALLKYWGPARKIIKEGALPDSMQATLGSTTAPLLEWQARAGGDIARFTKQHGWEHVSDNVFTRAASKVVRKSFDLNAFFDDTYRTIAYLYGVDKELANKAGLGTREAAEKAGEALARKTLQTMDDMTPMERSILRYMFPFYGFTRHILKYAYKYPMDHPFRVAVTNGLVQQTLDDFGTGLPQFLLNNYFLGHPDSKGNVNTVQVGGMNPFRDVANYTTLAGWVGSLNPLLSTTLEQMGIDTRSGTPELYPNLGYDPVTGRLKPKTGNVLLNGLYNTIPQTQLFAGILDHNSDFRDLMRTNPDAAQRMLISQSGFPVLVRGVNVHQEMFKAELSRQEDQSLALSAALKSGNDQTALQYPALRPLLAQVRQIQGAGGLGAYASPRNTPEMVGFAQQAILASVGQQEEE